MVKIIYAVALLACVASTFAKELVCTGEHEHRAENKPICPLTCANRHSLHCYGMIEEPSCQCEPGYIRDDISQKCIPREDCPGTGYITEYTEEHKSQIRRSCDPATEFYSEKTPACPPSCMHGYATSNLCDAVLDKPSCQCRHNYLRDLDSHKCILSSQCHFRF